MSGNQLMENLRELTKMKQDGSLTDEEFKQFKEKLMNDDEPSTKKTKTSSDTIENDESINEKATHPTGSWTCNICQNINWPMRTHCNRKSCQLPRWQVDPAGAGMSQPQHMSAQMMGSMSAMGSMGSMGASIGQQQFNEMMSAPMNNSALGQQQIGASLGGYNYDSFNGVAGVSPHAPYGSQQPTSGGVEAPPGSWTCVSCGNTNWPMRKSCNRKNCQKPRTDGVDGGGVGMNSSYSAVAYPNDFDRPSNRQNPPGSWECVACGNVNWPMRTVCNRKECNAARPPSKAVMDAVAVATGGDVTGQESNPM